MVCNIFYSFWTYKFYGLGDLATLVRYQMNLFLIMSEDQPRVSYKGTEINEYAEQAWSTISHSGRLIKYKPTRDPCQEAKESK